MQKLHPRAVWLFFFSFILRDLFLVFIIGLIVIPTMMAAIIVNTSYYFLEILALLIFILIPGYLIFRYIWARLSYRFWRYELTENVYKAERGVIWKRYVSIPYDRIQNVDIYRGILARLLGLSDIQIQTAGYGAAGARGVGSEGRLPGLDKETAERIREELIKRARQSREQGL